ncbi:MAG: M14 family metallopeptidase [Thermoguttaceae bacterium]
MRVRRCGWAGRGFRYAALNWLAVGLLAVGATAADDATAKSPRVFAFADSGVVFDADFDGARLSEAVRDDEGGYRIVIRPENRPINASPWYAFRVRAATAQTIAIRLTYEGAGHRYRPKTRVDGIGWQPLPADRCQRTEGGAVLRVDVGPKPVWIAGQEMVGTGPLDAWTDKIAGLPFVRESEIGRSVGGRPLRQLTIREGEPKLAVAIIGRQHPPEVTGTLALMEFVETLAGPSGLAGEFRRRFETAVVPLMNPDGVAAGNWRHNVHGVDLNRDWDKFRQPETQAARDSIFRYQSPEMPRLAFFLDFHSTGHDVFYVQSGEDQAWPAGFSERWLEALAERLPDYKVSKELNPATGALSKVWARKVMKVPAVIYEVGDNTDRELIGRVARASAEEMMRLLLEEAKSAPQRRLRPRRHGPPAGASYRSN